MYNLSALSLVVFVVFLATSEGQPVDDKTKLWLDANILSSTHKDGDPVITWRDKSTTSCDALFQARILQFDKQANVPDHSPPVYRASVVNNLPVVEFDASKKQTLVLNNNGSALDRNVAGITMLMVMRAPYVKEDNYLYISHNNNFDTRFSIILNDGRIRFNIRHKADAKPVNAECMNRVLKNNEFGILVVAIDYYEGTYYCRYNGVPAAFTPAGSPPAHFKGMKLRTENLNSPYNAIASTGAKNHLTCQIAELKFFDEFFSQDRIIGAEKLLMNKYDLE